MSNALFALPWIAAVADATSRAVELSAATAPHQPEPISRPLMSLIGMGIVVLVVWGLRRLLRPRKLALAAAPGRPNRVHVIHVLVLLLLWPYSAAAARMLSNWLLPLGEHETTILAGIAGQLVWLAGSLAVASLAFSHGLRRGLGLDTRHWIYDSLRGLIGYLAVLPVCFLLLRVSLWLLPGQFIQVHPTLVVLRTRAVSGLWLAAVIVSATVLAPLCEEIFFRGLLQSMLRRLLPGPWPAIAVSSAVFAGTHFQTPQNIPALLALSVVLGYNYERTGRLLPSILIHAIFNAVFIAEVMLGPHGG